MSNSSDQELLNAVLREIVIIKENAIAINALIREKRNMIQDKLAKLLKKKAELKQKRDRAVEKKQVITEQFYRLQDQYDALRLELNNKQQELNICLSKNAASPQSVPVDESLKRRVQELLDFLSVNGPFMQEINGVRKAHAEVSRGLADLQMEINMNYVDLNREERQLSSKSFMNTNTKENDIHNYSNMMEKICNATEKTTIFAENVAKLYDFASGTVGTDDLCKQIQEKQTQFQSYIRKKCGGTLDQKTMEKLFLIPRPLFRNVDGFCVNVLDLFDAWSQPNANDKFSWNGIRLSNNATKIVLSTLSDVANVVGDNESLQIISKLSREFNETKSKN